jgi:hypothetical protein
MSLFRASEKDVLVASVRHIEESLDLAGIRTQTSPLPSP